MPAGAGWNRASKMETRAGAIEPAGIGSGQEPKGGPWPLGTSSQAFGLAAFGSRTDRGVLYACALDTLGLLVQHVVHRRVLLGCQRTFDLDENGMFALKLDGSDGETPQLHETLQAALDLGAVLFDQPAIGHESTIVARDNDFLSMYSRHGRSLPGSNAPYAQMAAVRRRLQRKIRWRRVDKRGQNNAEP